ncbi:MAG TPA: universal stress protein [Acidimicrobiales bacterium]|jgi:nucleotide-binding universal stress UspA family protein|nr:universal stress protein [Acidimicrobiales bacterium]
MPDVVVVGVDGSPNAWHALEWAAAEAALRGATLRIVSAFEDPVTGVGLGTAFGAGAPINVDPSLIEDAAKDVANEGVRRAGNVPTEVVARCDRPGDVLLDASKGAALLVVGSRGHGAVGSFLLGSVSNFVVHHASCPVVIVPPQA